MIPKMERVYLSKEKKVTCEEYKIKSETGEMDIIMDMYIYYFD